MVNIMICYGCLIWEGFHQIQSISFSVVCIETSIFSLLFLDFHSNSHQIMLIVETFLSNASYFSYVTKSNILITSFSYEETMNVHRSIVFMASLKNV